MPQKKLFSVLRVATLAGSIVSLVFLSACAGTTGGSTGGNPSPNPAPTVTSLSPTSATAGAASLTLTVNGTNFISSSTVLWNGSARSTTFVSSVELQAAISASDVASAGTAPVTVSSPAPGGGTSSSLAFTISNPAPVIGSLNPSSIVAGSGAFTLSVNGSNFTSDAVVEWNSASRTTTYVSGTSLQAAITMADVASAGSAQVTVF
ncbi:MAG: IPT/TIG domain-containing protein, partial [Candidatus Acidiferrales bacterium]